MTPVPTPEPPVTTRRAPFQPALQAAVYILLTVAPVWLFSWVFIFVFNQFAGSVLAVLTAALFANFFCFRAFDGVGLERLGLPWNRPGLINSSRGVALGFGAAALVIAVPLITGHAHEVVSKVPVTWQEQLFVPFMLVLGAAGEEILFRGFGFQVLLRGFGPFTAVLPIGALFGFMHGANPYSTIPAILNTIGFGILFGYAFVRSHDIWFPLGLHYGWNLTLLLFGANISGLTMRITTYEVAWDNSAFWSGGAYGPEASFFTTAALLILTVAVWKVRVVRQDAYLVDDARRGE